MTKKLNIAFAGGGSGGHVMPISSLIKYIYQSDIYSDHIDNIFWFGQKGQMEQKEFDNLSKYITNININNLNGLIINNNTHPENLEGIKNILLNKGFNTVDIIDREDFDFAKQDNYDIYILSGGHDTKSAKNHIEFYDNELELLQSDKNIIGICLGMQIIAKYFGSQIVKNESKIQGEIEIEYKNQKVKVREQHQYIVNTLGEDLISLAKSQYGHEIIKHKNKSIYGIQFHPEKHIKIQYGDEIFEDILDQIFVQTDNNIYIYQATVNDFDEIKNINNKLWQNNINEKLGITKSDIDKFQEITREERSNNKEKFIKNIFIAKQNNEIVGYTKFFITKQNTNLLHSLYIKKEYQGKGIGSILLNKVIKHFDTQDIHLEVVKYNYQAIRFYEKYGFEIAEGKKEGFEILSNKNIKILTMIKSGNKPENISDINNIKFFPILSGKLRRQPNFQEILLNIADVFKFVIGIFQSLRYIYIHKIDTIFCKGGYVALPAVIAAKILGRKIIVHESDTKPGLVNKIAAKFANVIYTGFDNVLAKEQVIGQIISNDIIPQKPREKPQKTTILVNLGSLGSASIHDALLYILSEYSDLLANYEWHIILGSLNADYETKYKKFKNLNTYLFVDQKTMGNLLYISDISICRGGTTTLAEQNLFNIKQIIIPIPRTHDQSQNAKYYQDKFEDIYITQDKNTKILGNNIYNNIIGLQDYHKTIPDTNHTRSQIQTAKQTICDELIR